MDITFLALSQPVRRDLLDKLYENNGQTLGELCADSDMTRQGVSKHLTALEKCNLIVTVKRGRNKLHYLNCAPLHEMQREWFDKFERNQLRFSYQLKKALNETE